MSVDVTHLVQETAGDTNDQVVHDSADGPQGSDSLAVTMVDLDGNDVLLGPREGDSQMRDILDELAC